MVQSVKDKNKGHYIIKQSFIYSKKYIVWIIVACLLSLFTFTIYTTMNVTNKRNDLDKTKQLYGTYIYMYSMLNEEQMHVVEQDSHTLQSTTVAIDTVEQDENELEYYYCKKEILEFSNMQMTLGKFPKGEDEIAVQKWYLFQLGYQSDDMLGATIELLNPETNKKEKKKIVGLFTINNQYGESESEDGIPKILMNRTAKQTGQSYSTYVVPKDASSAMIYVEELASKLNKMNKKVYEEVDQENQEDEEWGVQSEINMSLLHELGYTEEARNENRLELILYNFILCIITLFVFMTLNNVITICIYKWHPVISVYKLLGIHMMQIRREIMKIILRAITLGSGMGILLGMAFVMYMNHYTIQFFGLSIEGDVVIPYRPLTVIFIIYLIIGLGMVFIKSRKYLSYNAIQVLSLQSIKKSKKKKTEKLFYNSYFNTIKLALRNLFFYKWRKCFMLLSVMISVLLVFTLSKQVEEKTQYMDNNEQFEYRFEVTDFFELRGNDFDTVKKIYKQIEDICEEHKLKIYYSMEFSQNINLDKKYLSDEYRTQLMRKAATYTQIIGEDKTIDQEVVLLGYSDEMLQELYEMNGMEYHELGENEMLVLNRTVNRDNTKSYKILPMVGEGYTFDQLNMVFNQSTGTFKDGTLLVKDSVNQLPLYPNREGNYLCFIMRKDVFNLWYNFNYVNQFYIKSMNKETLEAIQDVLLGTNFVRIYNQEEEYEEKNGNYTQSALLYVTLLLLCSFCTILNLQLMSVFDFDSRKYEYAMFSALGVSKTRQRIVAGLESFVIFGVGFGFGVLCSKFAILYMYKVGLMNHKEIPLNLFFVTIFILALCMVISVYLVWKRLSEIEIVKDLS